MPRFIYQRTSAPAPSKAKRAYYRCNIVEVHDPKLERVREVSERNTGDTKEIKRVLFRSYAMSVGTTIRSEFYRTERACKAAVEQLNKGGLAYDAILASDESVRDYVETLMEEKE